MKFIQRKLARLLAFSIVLGSPLSAHSEDVFVPCSHLGRLKQCITVSLSDPSKDVAAKKFQPSMDGKGKIYVVRPYTNQPREKSDIFLDGKLAAEMAPSTYVVLDAEPGEHRVRVHTDDDSEVVLNVLPGHIYYVKYQLDLLFNTISGKLAILDEREGQTQILNIPGSNSPQLAANWSKKTLD